MAWIDGYADKYQEENGFEAIVYTKDGEKEAWISMKPTTRAAYDLSMRENTIDGIITMNEIEKLKAGYIYILKADPYNKYFIQTLSKWEQQLRTININAIRCNCTVTVQRKGFADDEAEKSWINIYEDVDAEISLKLNDSKNFNAGFENATYKVVQMPMWEFVEEEDEEGNVIIVERAREIRENDRLVVKSNFFSKIVGNEIPDCEIEVESVDNFGISGTIRAQGTQEMRA